MLSTLARSGRVSSSIRSAGLALQRRLVLLTRGATWWREILLIGLLYGVYELSRGAGDIDMPSAISNGREIMHVERVWHLAPERVLNEALERAEWLAVAASYFYSLMHYLVTPVVLVWMYRKHRGAYGPARTTLAISTALGLIVYLLLPTAPPRLLSGSGLRDTLADTQAWGWWGGEGSVPRGFGALANQFAAMPSLHVGWALWCGVLIAIHAQRRWVKLLGISYPVVTTIVVMATGNHYLLDAIAGALTVAAGALLAAALPRRAAAAIGSLNPLGETLSETIAGRSPAPVRAAVSATTASRLRCPVEREASYVEDESHLCRARR